MIEMAIGVSCVAGIAVYGVVCFFRKYREIMALTPDEVEERIRKLDEA